MTSPVSPELSSRIAEWRRKSAEGTMTEDEMRDAIVHLRAGRLAAANAAATAKRTAKKTSAPPPVDDLLNELGSM